MLRRQRKVTFSGQQDREMRESVEAARHWVAERARTLGAEPGWEQETDVHVHAGQVDRPKGGPSAAITVAASLTAALTGKPVRDGIALSGGLGLGDEVDPVGGVTEKGIGASRAGIREVYLPWENRKDRDPERMPPELRVHWSRDALYTVVSALEAEPQPEDDTAPPTRRDRVKRPAPPSRSPGRRSRP